MQIIVGALGTLAGVGLSFLGLVLEEKKARRELSVLREALGRGYKTRADLEIILDLVKKETKKV